EDGIRDGHVTGVQTCALPILLAWVDQVEGSMAPAQQRVMSAQLGRDAHVMTIELQPRREEAMVTHRVVVERFAVAKPGCKGMLLIVDFKRRLTRDEALIAGPPAHADDVFEEGVNRVKR